MIISRRRRASALVVRRARASWKRARTACPNLERKGRNRIKTKRVRTPVRNPYQNEIRSSDRFPRKPGMT
jgi:hypothetical protein